MDTPDNKPKEEKCDVCKHREVCECCYNTYETCSCAKEISEKNGTPREVNNMDKETIRAIIEAVINSMVLTKIEINPDERNSIGSIVEMQVIDAEIFLADLQKLIDSPSTPEEKK